VVVTENAGLARYKVQDTRSKIQDDATDDDALVSTLQTNKAI